MSRWRTISTVARLDIRRLFRDRVAVFFIAILPFVVILAIGSFIPSDDVEVVLAVVVEDDSEEARDLVDTLGAADEVELDVVEDRRDAERDLRLQNYNALVVVPEGYADDLAAGAASLELVMDPASQRSALVSGVLGEVVGDEALALTVRSALVEGGVSGADADEVVGSVTSELTRSTVVTEVRGTVGPGGSSLAFVAGGQMILFMFVNSLAAGAAVIEMRRLGVSGRILSGPADAGDLISGLGLSRVLVAGGLAGAIVVLASAIYGVQWGSPAVVVTVVVLFALLSAGASTLLGAVLDDPDGASNWGIPIGLGMAALGGCMFPLFLAPEPMQVAAKVLTPHAWAVDALLSASFDGAGLVDVWANVVVLTLWTVVLVGLGRTLARRRLRNP